MSADPELAVLFQSRDLVLVDKPSGVATEPDRRGEPSLRDRVGAWCAARGLAGAPHAVSRLDVPVSGVVTFALSDRAKKAAAEAKAEGRLTRRYLALVAGSPADEASCELPIEGRPASSLLRVAARVQVGRAAYAVVHLWPRTGRTHQLRIHAAALGAPILGDRRHGGPSSVADASGRVVVVPRVMLHAAEVWPRLGLASDPPAPIVAPTPRDLSELWSRLGGDGDAFVPRADPAAVRG